VASAQAPWTRTIVGLSVVMLVTTPVVPDYRVWRI
jgi:hypothetical protein